MMDVLITENITGAPMDALRRDFDAAFEPELWRDPAKLKQAAAEARAIIVRNQTQVTAEILAAADKLQIVARAGAGLDNVDTEAATGAGVVVSYAPHENSLSVAELAIGLMLGLARKLPAADADTRGGGWDRRTYTGFELSGKTLGIVGFGRIGRMVAERAAVFGMRLVTHDPFVEPDSEVLAPLGATWLELDDLLAESDLVTVHVPLTKGTAGLINDDRLRRMKPGAQLINTSRGEIVDEEALARALESGRLAGAALDVRQCEPPQRGALEQMPTVILTPHIGAFTTEAQERVVAAVCRDVAAVLRGDAAQGYFNFPTPKAKN
ncbi:MAG: hydroxyacid dehydrogenase [Pirellulaceae bacterium]